MDSVIDFNNYIKPELFILVPVLIIIGKFIKDSAIGNRHVPIILGVIGIVLSCGYLCIISGENIAQALITGAIQGILLAGASVYGNQIFKQYTNKNK